MDWTDGPRQGSTAPRTLPTGPDRASRSTSFHCVNRACQARLAAWPADASHANARSSWANLSSTLTSNTYGHVLEQR
jgi:hypothetical protein